MKEGRLRAGVMAAGRGERLRAMGTTMKPLVEVAGQVLIERVLTSIAEAGAGEVVVIINEESPAVRDHVSRRAWPFALRWIVETTPSSMHSFLRLVEQLTGDGHQDPVLISTVDTVAAPGAYARFVEAAARQGDADVTLALTDHVDDEKPLRVRMGGTRVMGFGGDAASSPWATAGYYYVRPTILREAEAARRDGLGALRAFLARLVACGYRVDGTLVGASIDVDRPPDVEAAEAWLRRVSV